MDHRLSGIERFRRALLASVAAVGPAVSTLVVVTVDAWLSTGESAREDGDR